MPSLNQVNEFAQRNISGNSYFNFIGLALLFLLLAFDRDLAMIYILIMVVDRWWYSSDNFVSFNISRSDSKGFMVYIESLVALGVFLLISTLLVSVFSPQTFVDGGIFSSAQSIFQLLATSTPILQGSLILTFIGWGILIPIIETSFFNGRLLEGFATYAEKLTGKRISLETYSIG